MQQANLTNNNNKSKDLTSLSISLRQQASWLPDREIRESNRRNPNPKRFSDTAELKSDHIRFRREESPAT
jgi:hypothetical protein